MANAAHTDYLNDKKLAPAHLGRVLVLGLGVSGRAVCAYCEPLLGSRIDALCVLTGSAEEGFSLDSLDGSAWTGEHFAELGQIDERFDLCIASPGISERSELYRAAASMSARIASEVEFAWCESAADARWVAITGTNGKSTTTALTAHLLRASGLRADAVGNIGDTCIDAVAAGATDVYVAEVSSYQLASTEAFSPECAVMLNITPDHLAWHGSFEAYVKAKEKVFANMAELEDAMCVLDATNDHVRAILRNLRADARCSYIPLGTAEGTSGDMRATCSSDNAAFVRPDGKLVVCIGGKEHELVHADELLIEGEHNIGNALAAASAALSLGADPAAVREGLRTFAPLEHRLEPCGSAGGVACYNDSKATNVDATFVALRALASKRPIILLGGDDKGTPLDELAEAVGASCKSAVCFGEAGPRFAEALSAHGISFERTEHLADALDAALKLAEPGDTVLLSPACASFDEFDNFEHRGRVFKELVAQLGAQAGQAV